METKYLKNIIIYPALVLAFLYFFAPKVFASSVQLGDSAGQVHLEKVTDTTSNTYLGNPTQSQQQWYAGHYARSVVYSPYWDSRLSWYPNGWFYDDSYAIYTSDSATLSAHPDWILKDSSGNRLYIDWACSNGSCPEYAADISNAAYRQWWINNAAAALSKGYKGLFVDDVNMDWRISDGSGHEVCNGGNNTSPCPTVIDPNTGQPMALEDWRKYFAQFMEQVRAAFPNYEIVHNSIWYAGAPNGTSDQYISRQTKAANYQLIEHGVTDAGITGGSGWYSLQNLQNYIDAVHALGGSVIIGSAGSTTAQKEYSLANYFLASNGSDMLGNTGSQDFWDGYYSGYDVNLGMALGARYVWNGLYRRDFSGGMVLVNPPGSGNVSVTLPASFLRLDSSTVSSLSLSAGQGAVLTAAPAATTTSTAQPVTINQTAPINATATAGNTFKLTYNFAGGPTAVNQTVFVHFYDQNWNLAFQDDHTPPTPTTQWAGNVSYSRSVSVPSTTPAGTYTIIAGLYDQFGTGAHLPLTTGSGVYSPWQGSYMYAIGTLTVSAAAPATSLDVMPPSVPLGLAVTAASSSQINLSWLPALDNVAVWGYQIYRNGSQIATTTQTLYSDTGLVAGTLYSYQVAAYDAAGNVSAKSAMVSAEALLSSTGSQSSATGANPLPIPGSSSASSGEINPPSNGGGTIIPATPVAQAAAATVSLINDHGTYYLVQNGVREGITSPGLLYSYGFDFKDAVPASAADINLPTSSLLLPGNGALVKSSQDPTVYLVSGGKRYGFTSAAVFANLGFKFSSVLTVTDPELQQLPKAPDLSDASQAHLPGTDVSDHGTIYWVGDGVRYPYTGLAIYNSWHRDNDFSQVVRANAADLALPIGPPVVARQLR